MYIKYIQIFRRLSDSYDQIVHPQKRRVLRHVLDGTMGRILELKNEMVQLEYSEFHYFDDVLSDLKLTPVSEILIHTKILLRRTRLNYSSFQQQFNKIYSNYGFLYCLL